MRGFARELITLGPHAGAHRAAVRCAVSIGVPMILLLALGRLDLLGAVTFGAFTAVYGRELAVPVRTRLQLLTGGGLTGAVAIGLAAAHLPGRPWSGLVVLVVVAGAATVLGGTVRWKPPGPIFFVFATGAFTAAPAQDLPTALLTTAVTAATALFAVLVGSLGGWLRRADAPTRRLFIVTPRATFADGRVVDVVIAATIIGAAAILLDVDHVYWAVVAAVVVAAISWRGPWAARGTLRVLGTLFGLLIAAPLLLWNPPPWAVVALAIVLQLCAELVVLRNYGLAMLFVTPLALVVGNTMHPIPAALLIQDRLVATVIGVAAGMGVLAVRAVWQRRADAADSAAPH